jgi:hypothetical protein
LARRIRYDNLTGGLNTVSSLGTINQSPNRTETPDCQNVEYFKLGGLKSMEGNTLLASIPNSVVCGHEYIKNDIKYMLIADNEGIVYVYNSATNSFDTIYTFPTATDRLSMVNFADGVVVTNGVDDLLYYNKGRNTLLTGTVSGTVGSTTLTGVNTLFSKELHKGEYIKIGSSTYKVVSISTVSGETDTVCTVEPALTETYTSSIFRLTEISLCNATLINSDDTSVSKPIRGLAINVYRGRLIVGGTDDNIYYSELGKYFGWDIKYSAGAFDPFYNDTSSIYALGLYGENLVVHRQSYSYLVSGTDSDPDNWQIDPFADISCESQQSFVVTNNTYYVYSRRNCGVYPLLKRNMFSDRFVGDELSIKIRNLFQDLNNSQLRNIYAVSSPRKRWLVLYMPFIQGTGSNIALVYDFQTNSWLRRVVPQEVTSAFRYNDKVYIGTADGKVLEEFTGLTFDGEKVKFYWKSPFLDFGDGSHYQSVSECRVQISEEENNDFYLRNYRDGLDLYKNRRLKNKSGLKSGLVWSDEEGLITETVWDDYEWADGGFTTYRFPLENAYFQQLQLMFCGNLEETDDGTTQGISLYGFELHNIQKEEVGW